MSNSKAANSKKKSVKRSEPGVYKEILKLASSVDSEITYNNVREYCLGRSVVASKKKIIAAARKKYIRNAEKAIADKIAKINSK